MVYVTVVTLLIQVGQKIGGVSQLWQFIELHVVDFLIPLPSGRSLWDATESGKQEYPKYFEYLLENWLTYGQGNYQKWASGFDSFEPALEPLKIGIS